MKIISFSLFGYNKRENNSFDFECFLRGLAINIRLARLLYPEWKIKLHVDEKTNNKFGELFEKYPIKVEICNNDPLTKAMLWRLKPLFDKNVERVICRDLDSPLTYREAQAVTEWEESGKGAHAITDSISHNIPMMGGMVGFVKDNFKERIGCQDWDSLVDKMDGYEVKGRDQDLLNVHVYPKFANSVDSSIMAHFFLGYIPKNVTDGYKTCNCRRFDAVHHEEDCPLNIELDIPKEYVETNNFCGHIGAAGWYEPPMFKFFSNHLDKFDDIRQAEESFNPEIFNWQI